jgi:hypothetical protein
MKGSVPLDMGWIAWIRFRAGKWADRPADFVNHCRHGAISEPDQNKNISLAG